jgi:hypothetical protein
VPTQYRATSAWQQGASTMKRRLLRSAKRIASSVAVSQACSAVTMSTCVGSCGEAIDSATVRLRKDMRSKPSRRASSLDFATSSARVFDAEHPPGFALLEEQVVEDEAEVGLAGAVVDQGQVAAFGR